MQKLKLPKKAQEIFMGSIIHWNEPISHHTDPRHHKRVMVPITCGKCKNKRYWRLDMVVKKVRTGEFTGICKKCYNGLTWKEKHRLRPARRKLNDAGYMKIFDPQNPMADKRGEVYEHRLVMSQVLDRSLEKWEHVHHKDGNRANNSPNNLELVNSQQNHSLTDMITRIKYLENLLKIHNIPF